MPRGHRTCYPGGTGTGTGTGRAQRICRGDEGAPHIGGGALRDARGRQRGATTHVVAQALGGESVTSSREKLISSTAPQYRSAARSDVETPVANRRVPAALGATGDSPSFDHAYDFTSSAICLRHASALARDAAMQLPE